ncbi:HD domain-containing protein [Deinococcus sp.]|uniref:HD domain-containing protein n=1 Tax=Deinococcus sp. TaxID=47478 RepID=UPI003C7E3FFB
MTHSSSFPLGSRFDQALMLASEWHHGQYRKVPDGEQPTIPYLSHLLGVASLALEFGASEDEAIAALLHDALEDGPDITKRTPADLRAEMVAKFGESVAALVDAATDDKPLPNQPKKDWATRKRDYLHHLEAATPSELLVSASDKLYNARSILVDVLSAPAGEDVFERFNQKRDGTLQYYRLLADTYTRAATRPEVAAQPRLLACFAELERTVSSLEQTCGLTAAQVRDFPPLRAVNAL